MSKYRKLYSYLFIIVLSVMLFLFYQKDIYYYDTIKYLTTTRSIDIMFSILFVYLFLQCLLDGYYFHLLNRNHIIIRYGRRRYFFYIIKKILFHLFILLILNFNIDYLLTGKINYIYNLINIVLTGIIILILPKQKEYINELLISIVIVFVIRLFLFLLQI